MSNPGRSCRRDLSRIQLGKVLSCVVPPIRVPLEFLRQMANLKVELKSVEVGVREV